MLPGDRILVIVGVAGLAALTWHELADEPGTTWTNEDDLDLARRVASDRASFGILYDRYVHRIYGYCYRRLGNREAAEDATSQTFLKLLAALQKPPRKAGSIRSWIFTIAYHVMIDDFRTARPTSPLNDADDLFAPTPGPDAIAVERETGRELHRLVARLPGEQSDLVYLRLAGLTDQEIAQVLGKSFGAVRIGQHRAIKRLRTMYAQIEGEQSR